MAKALMAIDIQNGNVTPQNQEAVLLSLTALSKNLDEGNLVVVSTCMYSPHSSKLWDIFRAEESEALFSPLEEFIAAPANTAAFQRTSESACTSAVKMLLKTHGVKTITIVGINTGHNIITSALDFAELGFQVEILVNAVGDYPRGTAINLHKLITEK